MIYSATGRYGTVRFDGRTVVISKRKGFGRSEVEVPLSQITSVRVGRIGFNRFFRVGTASAPDPRLTGSALRHDDLTLLHSSGSTEQFDALKRAILAALSA